MKNYDLMVLGGGLTGCAAAVAAARNGAKVLLIERGNALGGAAVNCLVNPYMRYWTDIDGVHTDLSAGFFAELNEKLAARDALKNNVFDEEILKSVLQETVLESGAELLFHAFLVGAEQENGAVKSITLATKAGLMTLSAPYYIDATGDADLTNFAGFPCRLGREEDGLCQPMTLCFRLAGVDLEQFRLHRAEINPLYDKFRAEGKITNPRENVLIFSNLNDGVLHFNTTRVVKRNPVDPFDVTQAEIEARRQVFEIVDFLKANIPGFENSRVIATAADIGVRESRMIEGEHVLTGDELVACTQFPDSIALGNYDIDIHNPEGTGTSHYFFPEGTFYSIPYRCLIPKNARNLLVGGRCISVDHRTQASIRILPIVCTLGEAAGTAMGIAIEQKQSVQNVDINELHRRLSAQGAQWKI